MADFIARRDAETAKTARTRRTMWIITAAAYVVVMFAFLWLSIAVAAAGHGPRILLFVYAVLALPASALAAMRWAFPEGSAADAYAVIPLVFAPSLNVLALNCWRAWRKRKQSN